MGGIIRPGDHHFNGKGADLGNGMRARKASPKEVIEARLLQNEKAVQTLTEMQLATESILQQLLPDYSPERYYAVCQAVHDARTIHQQDQAKGRALIEATVAQNFPYKLAKESVPVDTGEGCPPGD